MVAFNFNSFRSIGVLEYWSNDERSDVFFFNTPVLHLSIAPRPRLSRTVGYLINYLFMVIIPKNHVTFHHVMIKYGFSK